MLTIASLYRFAPVDDPVARSDALLDALRARHVTGTLIIAPEGINGTICGPEHAITNVLDEISRDHVLGPGFSDLVPRLTRAGASPFRRTMVRVRDEIVTMGVPGLDPVTQSGRYVDPQDWNDLVASPDVTVVDTRNDYEIELGTFEGAIDPGTSSFTEFPAFVEKHLDPRTHPRVAMFCTGGIRCEKATAFLRRVGFEEVLHLRGGVLSYLDAIDPAESLWKGECFVFDDRMSLDHDLRPTGRRLDAGDVLNR